MAGGVCCALAALQPYPLRLPEWRPGQGGCTATLPPYRLTPPRSAPIAIAVADPDNPTMNVSLPKFAEPSPIHDVKWVPLKFFADQRGWLTELFRHDLVDPKFHP